MALAASGDRLSALVRCGHSELVHGWGGKHLVHHRLQYALDMSSAATYPAEHDGRDQHLRSVV